MTVIEIAKRAGVSIGTVDRVLHKRGRVSEDTRKRIQDIIDEVGYQPNPLARHLKRNKRYLIGVLIPELEKESRYWNLIHQGIAAAVEELSAFSFTLASFPFTRPDRNSLAAAFDKLVDAECDAWIIAPVMQEETLILLMGVERKVPYVLIDSPLPGSSAISTVAQDPFRGGCLAGRLMELISHSGGPYAVIRPYIEAYNLNERVKGFMSWFERRPEVRVLDVICSESDMVETNNILDRLIGETPDLRGFFTVSAIGHKIADFVVARGLKDSLSIIGYDLVAENVARLKGGQLDCLISQRPEEQGRLAVQQIYHHIVLEDEVLSQIDMPLDIFLKENIV